MLFVLLDCDFILHYSFFWCCLCSWIVILSYITVFLMLFVLLDCDFILHYSFSDVVCVAGLWFYLTLQFFLMLFVLLDCDFILHYSFFWCCLCSWIVILSYITVFLMLFVLLDCDFILHYSFSDVVCVAGLWFYLTLQFFWCCLCCWIVILSYITVFLMLFVLLDCDFILHYSFSDVVCVAGLWFYPTLQFFWCCLCSWIVILSYITVFLMLFVLLDCDFILHYSFSDVVCVAGLWFYLTLQFFWCCLCSWIVILSYITVFLMLFVLLDCDFILHYSFSDVVCVAGLWFYLTLQFFLMLFVLLDCDFILHYSFSDVVCVAGLWFYLTLQFFWCCLCSWIVILSYITVFLMLFVLLDCDFILHYSFSDVVCVAGLWFYLTLQFFWCCLCSWIVILSYITVFLMLFV